MLPALLAAIRSVPWSLRRATAGHGSELGGALASCRAEPVELAPRAPAQPAIAHGRGQLPGAQRSDAATEILSAGEFERCIERERCRADRGKRCFSMVVLRAREDAGTTRLDGAALTGFARQLRRRLRSTDIVGHVGSGRLEVLLTDTETKGAQVVIAWAKQAELRLGFELEHSIHVYPAATELDRSLGLPAPLQTGRVEPARIDSEDAQPLEVPLHASSIA